ncbi:MAG: enoyl-CoA hydratase/isomerase family protein, partial [Nitrospinaceae bacterium]|nr:enoyl-CoA hydratase/isomerase family protein [Nitrospinaceae bacterium]
MSAAEEKFAGGKLLVRREGAIASITLNHPDKMNSIELEMWAALARLVPELDGDDAIRVLVFRGAGERAFSAGADISRFAEERSNSAQAREYSAQFLPGLDAVEAFSKPTVAMIRGACVGGGAELAAATD